MRALFLDYDIPTGNKSPIPVLRRVGVRASRSVWIVPEHLMPWNFFNGYPPSVTWHTVRFDEGEKDKLRKMARDALERELSRIKNSMEECLTKAQNMASVTDGLLVTEEDRRIANKKRDTYIKNLLRRSKKEVNAAQEASLAFDLLMDVQEALDSIKNSIAAETSAFIAKVAARDAGRMEPSRE